MLGDALNNFWKQHPTKSSCMTNYLPSDKSFIQDAEDLLGRSGKVEKNS